MPILRHMLLHEILTQKWIPGPSELGRRLGIWKQHDWRFRHGKVLPGPEWFRRLRDQLNIPLDKLVELEPAEPIKPRALRPKQPMQPKKRPRRRHDA